MLKVYADLSTKAYHAGPERCGVVVVQVFVLHLFVVFLHFMTFSSLGSCRDIHPVAGLNQRKSS